MEVIPESTRREGGSIRRKTDVDSEINEVAIATVRGGDVIIWKNSGTRAIGLRPLSYRDNLKVVYSQPIHHQGFCCLQIVPCYPQLPRYES